jgi:hypothetical protein
MILYLKINGKNHINGSHFFILDVPRGKWKTNESSNRCTDMTLYIICEEGGDYKTICT